MIYEQGIPRKSFFDGPTTIRVLLLREAEKKVLLLMAGPLKHNPHPLELNGHWNVGNNVPNKVLFPLMARPLRADFFLRLPLRLIGLYYQLVFILSVSSLLVPIYVMT